MYGHVISGRQAEMGPGKAAAETWGHTGAGKGAETNARAGASWKECAAGVRTEEEPEEQGSCWRAEALGGGMA